MADASDTPHADDLKIAPSPNGKWMLFDFTVGDKHAFISMDTKNFPAAFQALLGSLNVPALVDIRGPDLPAYGYFETVAVRPAQFASSITPLGDNVVLAFELPGAIHLPLVFRLDDAKKLRSALDEAILKCEMQLTKQ
jgi:hypothetical protein